MILNENSTCFWVDGNIANPPKKFPVFCKVLRGTRVHRFTIDIEDTFYHLCRKAATEPFKWLAEDEEF